MAVSVGVGWLDRPPENAKTANHGSRKTYTPSAFSAKLLRAIIFAFHNFAGSTCN